jgi:hypothetical protein
MGLTSIHLLEIYILFCSAGVLASTGDESCAVLYDGDNLSGNGLKLGDGLSFYDLKNEYITHDTTWDKTASVQVRRGCIFTVCNEPYFHGACQEFHKDVITFPAGFDRIASTNCSCSKVKQLNCGHSSF